MIRTILLALVLVTCCFGTALSQTRIDKRYQFKDTYRDMSSLYFQLELTAKSTFSLLIIEKDKDLPATAKDTLVINGFVKNDGDKLILTDGSNAANRFIINQGKTGVEVQGQYFSVRKNKSVQVNHTNRW